MLNKTPFDWFSKKQGTVETATYGSEFVSARICTDQIVDIRLTLRYLGVPISEKSYMFGDNQSVVTSSTVPDSRLQKRHVALSYHRVREAMASGFLEYFFIEGKYNPADILSKHWGYQQVWQLLQPIMFCKGDTAKLFSDETEGMESETLLENGECQDSKLEMVKTNSKQA